MQRKKLHSDCISDGRSGKMRRRYLTVENGIAAVLTVGGAFAGIVVKDAGMRVCFATLSLSALFYLILNIVDIKKSACRRCGKRIWDKRTGKSEAKRIDSLDDSGELVRITVVCPRCGEKTVIWEK